MIESFYDALAPHYKLVYQDWESSRRRQARDLQSIIHERWPKATRLLDAACGIGTQSIGLAQLGYDVTGSTLSLAEVGIAREEARRAGVKVPFRVDDMRRLEHVRDAEFDVVLACDNAIPHLLSEAETAGALEQFARVVRPGGGCVVSMRDYDALDLPSCGTHLNPRGVRQTAEGRVIVFDTWDMDGDYYDMTMYLVYDTGAGSARTVLARGGRCYMISLLTVAQLMHSAGFAMVQVLRQHFFQPVIVGTRK